MIDCRSITLDDARLALVVRAARRHRPPLALLVTPEQQATLAVVDDHLDDVPVTTDPAWTTPTPKATPVTAQALPSMEDLRASRSAELQQLVRDHVDAGHAPREREDLRALLQQVTLARVLGIATATQEWVAVVLLDALAWSQAGLALEGAVAARCAACSTVEELEAVTVDLGALGPPPTVTAGEIALALREG